MAVTPKKTFSIEYRSKDKLPQYAPLYFRTQTFFTTITEVDQAEAERQFEKFYPCAEIVRILEIPSADEYEKAINGSFNDWNKDKSL